ncbi:MAG TPA: metalloregulator ArsR/SmtB family transcription factor [Hyphomicrobiales bacterium]|nr:metalloregulator ArsR/SmtB family transcription factor [Hyphomicrobiales bacterium]
MTAIGFPRALQALRAAGEPTRLRVVALLKRGELTVKDLTAVLGQSQPRISRHLKLLTDAGLVERAPEGAWAYYRLAGEGGEAELMRAVLALVDAGDEVLKRDEERYLEVRAAQAEAAATYFKENAAEWDRLRSLHVAEAAVEVAIRAAVGERPFGSMIDLGTGTGRMLEVLAPLYERAVGIDSSPDMLAVARANLAKAGIAHARVQHGDIFHPPVAGQTFELVVLHQVLHYLDDPGRAIAEAARLVRPGGRLLIVDFAPHSLEFLREEHAHRRLGFSHEQMAGWLGTAGIDVVSANDLAAPGGRADGLTVTVWLGRDRRMLIAGAAGGAAA